MGEPMHHAKWLSSGRRPFRRGATAIEFALILPVLLTIVLGCVDFGRLAYSYIGITNAAREGASYGSIHPYTVRTVGRWRTAIRQAVIDEMSQMNGFDPSQLSVTATPIPEGNDWRVQVDVSYPFQTIINWPYIPSKVTLQQIVVMRGIR